MRLRQPFIVGVGGTLRDGSTSEQALRLALAAARRMGCTTAIFPGAAINLPPYDPAERARSSEAEALVDGLRRADGLIVASPGYHGSISGLLKNALDYAEDLRGDRRAYLSDRAFGIIVCADGVQAIGSTVNTLRSIAHALRAWPTPYAAAVNSAMRPFAADGSCSADTEQGLTLVATQVAEFAAMHIAASSLAAQAQAVGEAQRRG